MKKLSVISALSLFLLALLSCEKSDVSLDAGKAAVTVSFGIEDAAVVKAGFGSGSSASVLEYRVYVLRGTSWDLTGVSGRLTEVTYPCDITLFLVPNMTYRIACFAQSPQADAAALYDLADFDDIAINYDALQPNSDMGDAFCATRQFVPVETSSLSVVLRRPLAQFNVFTGDMALYNTSSVDNPLKSIRLKFYDVPTKMGIVQGTAEESAYVPVRVKDAVQDYEFTCDVLTGEVHGFEGQTYDHLSMNYLLASPRSEITSVDLTLRAADGTVVSNVAGISNVPYQANYRTNLYGNLITNAVNFNIDIDAQFDKPDHNVIH